MNIYPRKKTIWLHCKQDGLQQEMTAYINADDLIYIEIYDSESNHDYGSQHICIDADTARDFANQLINMIDELDG